MSSLTDSWLVRIQWSEKLHYGADEINLVAEQMGRALQKTSVSTNVKERLDYSCALFDGAGGLVANAPHLPVHLGSMSTCVKRQAEIWKGRLTKGDVSGPI